MRPDQLIRIAELSEKLAEVVLEESDPDTWPGAGVTLAAMSIEERGNRYWSKKNAAASFSLLERTTSLLTDAQDLRNNRKEDDSDMEKQIAAREKEATKLLNKVMSKAKQVSSGKT